MEGATLFEQQVLDAFVAGDDERLEVLREQVANGKVTERKHTGVGSFTDFRIATHVRKLTPADITLRDVNIEVAGVSNPDALLFVRGGVISMLELVLVTGEWPRDPVAKQIGYLRFVATHSSGYSLVPVPQRDQGTLLMLLAGN